MDLPRGVAQIAEHVRRRLYSERFSQTEMPMATQPRRLRADDLPRIPVDDPDIVGYELVDGSLVPVMPANPQHSELIVEVSAILRSFVRAHRLGRVFADPWVRLGLSRDRERVRAPDVAFFSNERLQQSGGVPDDFFRVVPDLTVEIFSPTNERKGRDFQQRIRDFLDAGAPLLWVIHPKERYATVYRADGSARLLREHESLDGEAVLPGLTVPLADLFARMD
jgi:Uma2 family endonuclease